MTAQIPDELINEHPRVDLSGLALYGIIRGSPHENHGWGKPFRYPTPPSPPANVTMITALWRGYVAVHRLKSNGTLWIEQFRHLTSLAALSADRATDDQIQSVNEQITGDFWLVLKPEFHAPRLYVPFRDGKVVEDRAEWVGEERED